MSKRYAKLDFGGPSTSCMGTISWQSKGSSSASNNLTVLLIEDEDGNKSYISVLSSGSGSGRDAGPGDCVKINGKFGKALGFRDGQEVVVTQLNTILPTLKIVHVRCESEDDWEILESNVSALTSAVLNQIRVMYVGMRFPLWVSKSLSFNVIVEKMEPDVNVGIVDSNSEIVVPSVAPVPSINRPFTLGSKMTARIQNITLLSNVQLSSASLLLVNNVDAAYIYRSAVQSEDICRKMEGAGDSFETFFFARIEHKGVSEELVTEESKKVYVKIFFIENLLSTHKELVQIFPKFNPPTLFLHPKLTYEFNIAPKSAAKIVQVSVGAFQTKILRFSPIPVHPSALPPTFHWGLNKYFSLGELFLTAALGLQAFSHRVYGVHSGWLLITGKEGCGKSTFVEQLVKNLGDFPYFVHHELVSCVMLKGKKPENVQKVLSTVVQNALKFSPSVIILDDLEDLCPPDLPDQQNPQEDFLHLRLSETVYECLSSLADTQIAIVCTARSLGKLHHFWRSRQGVHIFQQEVHIPPPTPEERLGIFEACLRRYRVEAGAIRESSHKPHHPLPPPTEESQTDFSFQDNTNLTLSSACHENDQMTDSMRRKLLQLHDDFATPRILHRIALKWAHQTSSHYSILSESEREIAFESFLREETTDFGENETSLSAKKITWDQIGGLEHIKRELTKILIWPIKYASLFDKSPIKMPSGILLYGYPGTGKTIVGLATTSLVPHAKFIHIKGPELLSKFIGASEQSVQDLFRKARDLSPCILFFDEFDSLVPRRGHDSTGVTDRVVNAFLTEMDGIEGGLGKGVYLIASTSRPDLIDPAVLRPGRLDKHFFFPMPDVKERVDIMRALSRDIEFSDDAGEIRWDEIGRETDKFTAADLHSLLSTAQLEAIQDSLAHVLNSPLDHLEQEDLQNVQLPAKIPVSLDHIRKALDTTKPSMNSQEFAKYKKIYDIFSHRKQQNSKNLENEQIGRMLMEHGKKATLA